MSRITYTTDAKIELRSSDGMVTAVMWSKSRSDTVTIAVGREQFKFTPQQLAQIALLVPTILRDTGVPVPAGLSTVVLPDCMG